MAVYRDYQTINNQPVKVPYFDIACKFCGGHNVTKYTTNAITFTD